MTERLEFVAGVTDKFSAPLNNLKSKMREVSSARGPVQADADMESASRSASRFSTVLGGVRSSLGAIATAGGAAGAAFALMATRLGSFSGSTQSLILLGKETGLTVQRLRELQAVGERFSISPQQVDAGTKVFAKNLAEMKRGHGDMLGWLTTMDREMADKLSRAKSPEEAHGLAWGYLEAIKDPRARKRAAEMLFGDETFANLGSGIHGSLKKQFDDARQQLGRFDAEMEKRALQTEQNAARLRETRRRAEEQILGKGVAPSANRVAEALTDITKDDGRDTLGKIAENAKKLEVVDWAAIAGGIAAVGGALKMLGAGRMLGLLRFGGPWAWGAGVAGALGYSALRPRSNDELRAQIDDLTTKRAKLREELAGAAPDSPTAIAKGARLKLIEEALKSAEEKLNERMKKALEEGGEAAGKKISEALRNISPSSFDGSGGFGALIQKASLGGAVARDLAFGSAGSRGGSFFAPGGGRVPGSPISGDGPVARRARGDGGRATGSLAARIGATKHAMIDQLRREGVPEKNLEEAANLLTGQAIAESGLNPGAVHDGATGLGIYGARLGRRDKMLAWLQKHGFDRHSLEGQARYMAHEAMNGGYRRTRDALMNAHPSNRAANTHAITREFENPRVVNNRTGDVARAAGVTAKQMEAAKPGETGDPLVANGKFTSGFGMRRHPITGRWQMHKGVDLAAKGGSDARARQGGTVTAINGYGDTTIRYADGSVGVYRHVDPSVQVGQKIGAGDTIGTLKHRGADHRMTGPHLHYETRDAEGNLVNPRAAMEAGIVGRERGKNLAGFSDALRSMSERSRAFEMPKIDRSGSQDLLRDARGAGLAGGVGPFEFKGGADLRVRFENAPAPISTSTAIDGMISNVSIDRGRQIVNARAHD